MITGLTIIALLCAFIIFSFIGLFHGPIGKWMEVIRFYLRGLRPTHRNLKKLPKTSRQFYFVLRHRRGLLKIKLFKNFHQNRERRLAKRHERRAHRKLCQKKSVPLN